MAMSFTIEAQSRSDQGKGASRRLRRSGALPAIVYGGNQPPQAVTLDHDKMVHNLEVEAFYSHLLTLKIDGEVQNVVLRDLQRHPFKPTLLHVDFQRVASDERIHMRVPLHFTGEDVAPGVKEAGGRISHELTEVDISCLARDLPEFVEVDCSDLGKGAVLHLSDLKLPAGVELIELAKGEEHDLPVVSVQGKPGAAEAEDEAE